MTIREFVVDVLDAEHEPMVAMMGAMQLMRSLTQGEPATFDGCCGSLLTWVHQYGKPINWERIQRWLSDMKGLADFEVPNDVIFRMCDVPD